VKRGHVWFTYDAIIPKKTCAAFGLLRLQIMVERAFRADYNLRIEIMFLFGLLIFLGFGQVEV